MVADIQLSKDTVHLPRAKSCGGFMSFVQSLAQVVSNCTCRNSTGPDSYLGYLYWEAWWYMTQTCRKCAGERFGLVGFPPRSVGVLHDNQSRKPGRFSFAPDPGRSVWLPDCHELLHAQVVSQYQVMPTMPSPDPLIAGYGLVPRFFCWRVIRPRMSQSSDRCFELSRT